MNISALTGLPELPVGYFWHIGERERSYSLFVYDEASAFIAIKQEIRIDRVVDTQRSFWIFDWTWGTHVEPEVKTETFVQMSFVAKETYDEVIYDEDDKKIGVRPTERDIHLGADDLTEEIILKHAEVLFKKFQDVTKARGYLGDYPPKHLSRPEV